MWYIVALLLIAIFEAFAYFIFGWVDGWVLMKCFGKSITSVINDLLGTNRLTPEMLPIICGSLGVMGSFFKSHNFDKK